MNLPGLPQALDVDEVIRAPLGTEVVELPLLEDVEEGEVVALWDEELFPGRVRLFLAVLRSIPIRSRFFFFPTSEQD